METERSRQVEMVVDVPRIPLLTIKEAAYYLRVHKQTIRNYIKNKRINPVGVGRGIRIPRSEIIKLIDLK